MSLMLRRALYPRRLIRNFLKDHHFIENLSGRSKSSFMEYTSRFGRPDSTPSFGNFSRLSVHFGRRLLSFSARNISDTSNRSNKNIPISKKEALQTSSSGTHPIKRRTLSESLEAISDSEERAAAVRIWRLSSSSSASGSKGVAGFNGNASLPSWAHLVSKRGDDENHNWHSTSSDETARVFHLSLQSLCNSRLATWTELRLVLDDIINSRWYDTCPEARKKLVSWIEGMIRTIMVPKNRREAVTGLSTSSSYIAPLSQEQRLIITGLLSRSWAEGLSIRRALTYLDLSPKGNRRDDIALAGPDLINILDKLMEGEEHNNTNISHTKMEKVSSEDLVQAAITALESIQKDENRAAVIRDWIIAGGELPRMPRGRRSSSSSSTLPPPLHRNSSTWKQTLKGMFALGESNDVHFYRSNGIGYQRGQSGAERLLRLCLLTLCKSRAVTWEELKLILDEILPIFHVAVDKDTTHRMVRTPPRSASSLCYGANRTDPESQSDE